MEQLEKIEKHLGSIDVTLARQAAQLEEHMRRSEANERAVALLQKQMWVAFLTALSVIVAILTHK